MTPPWEIFCHKIFRAVQKTWLTWLNIKNSHLSTFLLTMLLFLSSNIALFRFLCQGKGLSCKANDLLWITTLESEEVTQECPIVWWVINLFIEMWAECNSFTVMAFYYNTMRTENETAACNILIITPYLVLQIQFRAWTPPVESFLPEPLWPYL